MRSSDMATISEPVLISHVKDANLQDIGQSTQNDHVTATYRTKYISLIEEVRIWQKDEVSLEKCQKKHFKFDIHQILTVKGFDPIILCQNGAVDFLANIKGTHSNGCLEESDVILKAAAFSIKEVLNVVCLVKRKTGEMVVCWYIYSGEDAEPRWSHDIIPVTLPVDIPVCTCDITKIGSTIKCYILNTQGDLYSTTISKPVADISTSKICHLSGINKSVSMVTLSSTHIAVAGIQRDNQVGIGIYDTRFDVLNTFRPFTEKVTDDVMVFHCNDCLFASYGKTIYMYPYSCQRSTVASILGKQSLLIDRLENRKIQQQPDKQSKTKDTEKEEKIQQLIKTMCDKKNFANKKEFSQTFSTKLKPLLKDYSGTGSLMLQFVQTCLSQEKFYPQQEIQFLVENLFIPSVLVPHLTDYIIGHKDTELLHCMMKYLNNVPESCLCKALEYILSHEEKKESTDMESKEDSIKCPLSEANIVYVNQILQMPLNDVFLVECIRTISFQKVLVLLEYLYYLLNLGYKDIEDVQNNPTLPQVVDWLCALLDGHFTQLIISPDARTVLVHLHTVVQSQVEFYDELLSLDALLQQLKSKCAIPQNKMVGQYCIEVLHIL